MHKCKIFRIFAADMKKRKSGLAVRGLVIGGLALLCMACNKPSRVEAYRAEKHVRDSIALVEQVRSMDYYQSQLERLQPKADSLLALFRYEKNDKYQDHGYYVVTAPNGLRVMVRDDGKQPILIYREGKRVTPSEKERNLEMVQRAEELQVVMSDIRELETRIRRTSLEISKYEKRLDK